MPSPKVKLVQVIYELYTADVEALCGNEDGELHAIDREIRLCFEDHQPIWLSWSSKPRQFCISYQDRPHFRGAIDKFFDMSNCHIWGRCMGREIKLIFNGPDRTMLEIATEDTSVWCWTEGSHGSDVLHVSSRHP